MNKNAKYIRMLLAAVLALALMLAAAGAYADANGINTYDELVAALNQAESGDIIELTGTIRVPAGETIDGKGCELKFGHAYAFQGEKGGSIQNCTIKNMTLSYTGNAGNSYGINIASGSVENVTFSGNFAYCIAVAGAGDIQVSNCVFSGNGWGIYTEQNHPVSSVTNCIFNTPRAVALYADEVFQNNIVNGDKGLSVATPNAKITGNTFAGARALSISGEGDGVKISGNKFLNESTIEIEANCNADLTGNYWGGNGGAPAANRLDPENTANSTITINGWYTDEAMKNYFDPNAPVASSMPSTGDSSMLMLWAALMAMSVGALVIGKRAKA